MSGTPNYNVDYEDERFQQVEGEKQNALTEVNNTYNNMVNQSDQYFNSQIEASKDWANQQQQIQQENTDFTIEQIEQQKEQANRDYKKEQSGAYVDWQKQSNKYGANAETMAANGMQGTGYSESSQVSMYNTYQNRVATARESYNQATLNYNNAIKEAQLQNNSALAEIAYQSYQQQLELSLQGFQYKNQLLSEHLAQQQATEDRYYSRYQDVLAQLNQENAFAEQVRQYNESLAEEQRQYNQNYNLQMQQYEESIRQFNAEMARLKEQDEADNAYRLQQLELQKQQLAEEQRQFDASTGSVQELTIKDGDKGSTGTETAYSSFGNSKDTFDKEDYYFSNGYQPRYVNNTRLEKSGYTIKQIFGETLGINSSQNIWKAGNKYYIWDGLSRSYIDVSEAFSTNTTTGFAGHSFRRMET